MKKIIKTVYVVLLIVGCGFLSAFFLAIFAMGVASMNAGY